MPPIPNTASAVIARLRGWADAKHWSKSKFAGEAGVVDTALRDFHKPDWNPTRGTLEKLEAIVPTGWQVGDPVPADASEGASATASEGVSA